MTIADVTSSSLELCPATGCMGMSMAYKDLSSTVTDEDSIATIHRALELGVTFLDTSDVYGPFTHEELVGIVTAGNSILHLACAQSIVFHHPYLTLQEKLSKETGRSI